MNVEKGKNNIRVLFVIPYLYEGGAQRALSAIQRSLPDSWEIETLVNSEEGKSFEYRGNIHTLGIKSKPRVNSVLFQIRVFLRRVITLHRLKREKKYDACISFSDSASVANIITGNKNCKVILSVRVSLKESAKLPQYRYIVNPLVKILYSRADQIVAVSDGIRKELIDVFGLNENKIVTIRNGYDVKEILSLAKNEICDERFASYINNRKIIISVGRLSFQKGQWHLIRAFNEVIKKYNKDYVLLIAGVGELEGHLKGLIDRYELSDRVYLLGHIDNVYKYLNISDCFVFSSLFEGFPNALAEAICVGLPCISTDFQTGAREILAPELLEETLPVENITECEFGILTPVCSDKILGAEIPMEASELLIAKAIVDLLDDEEKQEHYRMQSVSRRSSLDINYTTAKWIEVIKGRGIK